MVELAKLMNGEAEGWRWCHVEVERENENKKGLRKKRELGQRAGCEVWWEKGCAYLYLSTEHKG